MGVSRSQKTSARRNLNMGGNDLKDEDIEPGLRALKDKKNIEQLQRSVKKLKNR